LGKKIKFNTSSKKEKIKFFGEKVTSFIDDTHIEIFTGKEIIVDGCLGVLEFGDTYILLKLKKGNLTLIGNGLDIKSFEASTIVIGGVVKTLDFLFSERKND